MNNKIENILGDRIGYIELVDSMGSDLTIVNSARVSFDKQKEALDAKDEKLIKYLIEHQHFSPLRGVVFQFKAKVPIYIARQWWKHAIASSYVDSQNQWNEKSFRFVDIKDFECYVPLTFRQQSKSNKQCSDGELNELVSAEAKHRYELANYESFKHYRYLIDKLGVSREQARGVLPTSIYTLFIWTTSLQAVLNFISLRKGEGAQNEIALYAEAIASLIQPIVPTAYKAYFDTIN